MSYRVKISKKTQKELYTFITEHDGYYYDTYSKDAGIFYNNNKTKIDKQLHEYSLNHKMRIILGGNEKIHNLAQIKKTKWRTYGLNPTSIY